MSYIEDFEKHTWVQVWAGGWSLLTCSEFGELYARSLGINGKLLAPRAIFFVTRGKSACSITRSDIDAFGQHLVNQVEANPGWVQEIADELKKRADLALKYMEEQKGDDITEGVYEEFWSRILDKYKPHVSVKYIVDYLSPDLLETHLPILEEARLHAEPVFQHSEEFMEALAKQVSEKRSYPSHLVLSMLRDELRTYFAAGKLPEQETLQVRYDRSALLVDESGPFLQVGDQVDEIEAFTQDTGVTDTLEGKTAYPGKVTGTVRLVFDPEAAADFKEGDILVTGMTRPDFLPLMKTCAAYITDAGGMLSHAAITARELNKPCVIGTQVATKVLKDGDEVEVDADNGIVKILNEA